MQKNSDDKSIERRSRLTILQLMGLLAMVGILATWILHSFSA